MAADTEKPKETLKARLQGLLAQARDCRAMAAGVHIDLVGPKVAVEPRTGTEPDAPPPACTAALVQEAQRVLEAVQAALREVAETLAG